MFKVPPRIGISVGAGTAVGVGVAIGGTAVSVGVACVGVACVGVGVACVGDAVAVAVAVAVGVAVGVGSSFCPQATAISIPTTRIPARNANFRNLMVPLLVLHIPVRKYNAFWHPVKP